MNAVRRKYDMCRLFDCELPANYTSKFYDLEDFLE